MKLIFINDFLMHSKTNKGTWHKWFINIINPIIETLISSSIQDLYELKYNGENFSRETFFKLSNIKNYTESYYAYDIKSIKQASWDYLFNYITEETFIIGFEMGLALRELFNKKNIKFINFWVHSFKLFDDVPFMLNTNDINIYNILLKYQVPKIKFKFYANYWKNVVIENNKFNDKFIEDNCILFVGQTFKDASIKRGDKYLNILDFKDKLQEYSTKYSKIYYIPHPLVANIKEVDDYIQSTPYIEKLQNIPTYYLLSSDKIKKVIGISSSVLYEAQFFDKEIEYLYQPFFEIDNKFGLNNFVSILNDYFNPEFWKQILSLYFNTNECNINEILFSETNNKIRNIRNLYWGYKDLENINNSKINNSSNISNRNITKKRKYIYFKYYYYTFLSKITFGQTKKKLKNKQEKYYNLKNIKNN